MLVSESLLVVSNSLWSHGLYSPWNSPGQNTGVGSLSILQGIFPTRGSNPGLLHCRGILYQLSHKGSPRILGSQFLLQWIFPTQESNWGLLHCRWILYQLSDEVLGASTRVPTHDKVMRESPDGQGESGLKGAPPPDLPERLPSNQNLSVFTILRLSPTLLTLRGGYPRSPFSEENQLKTLVNKSLQ